MDILPRMKQLLDERGWTEYRLSVQCGLSQSTIGNIIRRNTTPSLSTMETICKGFGISMAQFFAENDLVEVTPEINLVDFDPGSAGDGLSSTEKYAECKYAQEVRSLRASYFFCIFTSILKYNTRSFWMYEVIYECTVSCAVVGAVLLAHNRAAERGERNESNETSSYSPTWSFR